MASDDIYLRKDVYEADQRALRMEISLGNERILKALEQFRVEMNGKLDQFKTEVNDKFDKIDGKFEKVDSRFDKVEGRLDKIENRLDKVEGRLDIVDGRLGRLETRFDSLETKVDYVASYLDSRISDTHTYMGWGFATIGIIVAIAVVVIPLTKMFKKFFKPSVTVEQVKEISRSIAEEVVNAKLQTM